MVSEPRVILLVEDNADDEQLTLRAMRQSPAPNIIQVARDGEEAWQTLNSMADKNRLPDVILLDLKLPKINGIELLRKVKSDDRLKRLPIVVLTSSDEDRDIIESYNFGANSYVRKPLDFDVFVDAVKQLGVYWLTINTSPR